MNVDNVDVTESAENIVVVDDGDGGGSSTGAAKVFNFLKYNRFGYHFNSFLEFSN